MVSECLCNVVSKNANLIYMLCTFWLRWELTRERKRRIFPFFFQKTHYIQYHFQQLKSKTQRKITKEILSNTKFLQQALKISEFKKENKASKVYVNLTFSMIPKISIYPNYLCKWKWNFPKHKQGEITNLFLYFP